MNRTDLFTPVHKAIRALLYETAALAARTAFADVEERTRLAQRVRALFAHLEEHQGLEDAVVMPELERVAPALFAELQNEHVRVGGLQLEIAGLLDRLERAAAGEHETLGQRLQHRLHRLVAAHLAHLEREEVEANRALWSHFVDADLQVLHARILARIAPPRMAEWMALILPALAKPERGRLLGSMRRKMPASVFASVTAPARVALGEQAWDAALAADVA